MLSNSPLLTTESCIAATCKRNIWFYLSRTQSQNTSEIASCQVNSLFILTVSSRKLIYLAIWRNSIIVFQCCPTLPAPFEKARFHCLIPVTVGLAAQVSLLSPTTLELWVCETGAAAEGTRYPPRPSPVFSASPHKMCPLSSSFPAARVSFLTWHQDNFRLTCTLNEDNLP